MVRKLVVYSLTFIVPIISGCMSLDPFLFDGEEVDRYLFDSYDGEQECDDAIDSLSVYQQNGLVAPFDDSLIHQFALKSGSETIAAVLIHNDTLFSPQETLIVYFHGKGPHIDYYWQRARLLHATGFPVLIVDYQGFGKSTGTPDEDALYEDGQTVIDYFQNYLGNPKVVVYAFSLGSIVGCEMAFRWYNVSIVQLILEAPVGTIETIVDDAAYLNLPGHYVTTYDGNNKEKIISIDYPFLWIHGTEDETLKRETHGEPLWENYDGGTGVFIKSIGGGHRTTPRAIGYYRYVRAVEQFIRSPSSPGYDTLFNGVTDVSWGSK